MIRRLISTRRGPFDRLVWPAIVVSTGLWAWALWTLAWAIVRG